MKQYVFYLLLAVIFLASCGERENKKDAQAYLSEIVNLSQKLDTDPAAIDAILNEGLATCPDNIPLLQFRADFDCRRGMLKECRADALRLLELKPDFMEARMMICMLNEFEGADRQNYEACYLEVAKALAARPLPPATSAHWESASKFEYVFTLLMARHPDAEKEKMAFLSLAASEPEWDLLYEMYRDMLENFDRERVLREIFGL